MKALSVDLYMDGVSLLCNIYSLIEDEEKEKYWTQILKNSPNIDFDSPSIEPQFLKNCSFEQPF